MSDDRRSFFKKAAGAAAALASADALLGVTAAEAAAPAPSAAAPKVPGITQFGLELAGKPAGTPRSIAGGDVAAEVLEEAGTGAFVCSPRKHLGNPVYQPLTIECGAGMGEALYDWIGLFFECKGDQRDGAVVAADASSKELWRLLFKQAFLTEVTFPVADAASKDAGFMTLKLGPEVTEREEGNGKVVGLCSAGKSSKVWLPSNFRLTIDGVDCTKVSKVGALTVTQELIEREKGGPREPGKLQVPNLVVALAEASAATFYQWHKSFVIEGNNAEGDEKNGKLEFLSSNLKDVIFTIRFKGLGIFKLGMDKTDATETIKRVTAEMYCQSMAFEAGKGVAAC